ncbi:MAG: ATP-grasp domain-containing protein [Nitrospinae bacterium]|nr:ATP-grasp domain-containing protein [Nitrospinota bacterium]
MRLLAVEYACAGGEGGDPFFAEGRAMLAALINDCQKAGFDAVTSLVHPNFDCGGIPGEIVYVRGDLLDTAREEMRRHDAVWVIAPETRGRLLDFTRLAESLGKRLIGSSSHAVETCGDKLLASQCLRGVAAMPESRPFDGTCGDFPCVVKPTDGAGCDNTFLIQNSDDLAALKLPDDIGFITQPFIPGEHFSAGIVSCNDDVELLGVCRQQITVAPQLRFEGVEGPIDYPHSEKVAAMARAVKSAIPALRGYWGMDFIDDGFGALTLIEVNPRLTSSYPLYSAAAPFKIPRYAIFGTKQ